MAEHERLALIRQLEKLRQSRVIAYLTSDRQPPFKAVIAGDVTRPFFQHLSNIGRTRRLDILVFSEGGDIIVPWRLVNLAREFCERLGVLVPYKAHSAATLLALGADEIVMGPLGELSPIDPSYGGPFNPPHPEVANEPKQEIGVEDVAGFLNLAKDRVGLTEQDALVRVFERLAERLHPLALGGVYRSHALIRILASKMLALHMRRKTEQPRIPQIVDDLAERLYYHGYLIGRREAEELGLKVKRPARELENAMWRLWEEYEGAMLLGQPFDPVAFHGISAGEEREVPVAMVESGQLVSRFFKIVQVAEASQAPPTGAPFLPQFVVRERLSGWISRPWEDGQP